MTIFTLIISTSLASAQQTGIYVASKLIYGMTFVNINNVKMQNNFGSINYTSDDDLKIQHMFGGALSIGYDFENFNVPVRVELDFAVFSRDKLNITSDLGGGQYVKMAHAFNIRTLLVNAYYDFNTGTKLTPYAGAGLGLGFISTKSAYEYYNGIDISNFNGGLKTMSNFAWNLIAGVGYNLTNNITLDAGYRLIGINKIETEQWDSAPNIKVFLEIKNPIYHRFELGLRYSF